MRLFLAFALTIMILNGFPIISQGIHDSCDQDLVKIAKIDENDKLFISCVMPNIAKGLSESGWYVIPRGSNTLHIIAEGISIEETKEIVTEEYTSQEDAQLIEDFSGGLGSISIIWKADNKTFSSSPQNPVEFLGILRPTSPKSMDMAYGELLKELGGEDDPNLVDNKLELLSHLDSLGWKLVLSKKLSNQDVLLYQFEKVIIE